MFGTITLSYNPSTSEPQDSKVTFEFSAEADIPTALAHFENFLKSLGYPLDFKDTLVIAKEKTNDQ